MGGSCARSARVIETDVDNGVKYIEGDVVTLIFDSSECCTGVKTRSGEAFPQGRLFSPQELVQPSSCEAR